MDVASLLQHIEEARNQALAELGDLDRQETVEDWRVAYLGRRGKLALSLREIANLPPDQRPAAGVPILQRRRPSS